MTQLHLDLFSCVAIMHVPSQLLVAVFMTQTVKHLHVACLPYRKECQLVTVSVLGLIRFYLLSFHCYIVPSIIRQCYMAFVFNLQPSPPAPLISHFPFRHFYYFIGAAFVVKVTRNRWRKSQSAAIQRVIWMSSVN
jgi:hypothetical protein